MVNGYSKFQKLTEQNFLHTKCCSCGLASRMIAKIHFFQSAPALEFLNAPI